MKKTFNEKLLKDVTEAIKTYNESEVDKNNNNNKSFNIGIRSVKSCTPRREQIKKATNEKLDVVARMAENKK